MHEPDDIEGARATLALAVAGEREAAERLRAVYDALKDWAKDQYSGEGE